MPTGRKVSSVTISAEILCWSRMPSAVVASVVGFTVLGLRVINDNGTLAGIVTDGDIARNLTRNLAELIVDDIMTRSPKTVKPTTLATTALGILDQHKISALIVTDETFRPVGIVHFHDLLRIGVA